MLRPPTQHPMLRPCVLTFGSPGSRSSAWRYFFLPLRLYDSLHFFRIIVNTRASAVYMRHGVPLSCRVGENCQRDTTGLRSVSQAPESKASRLSFDKSRAFGPLS